VTGPEALANGGTGTTFGLGKMELLLHFNLLFWNNGGQINLAELMNYAHITAPGGHMGSWNDLTVRDPTGSYQPKGYVVEYGGLPGEATSNL
jgi:hypothetical protein